MILCHTKAPLRLQVTARTAAEQQLTTLRLWIEVFDPKKSNPGIAREAALSQTEENLPIGSVHTHALRIRKAQHTQNHRRVRYSITYFTRML